MNKRAIGNDNNEEKKDVKRVSRKGVQKYANDLLDEYGRLYGHFPSADPTPSMVRPTPAQAKLLGHAELIEAARDLLKFDGDKTFHKAHEALRKYVQAFSLFKRTQEQDPEWQVVATVPLSLDTWAVNLDGKFDIQLRKTHPDGMIESGYRITDVTREVCNRKDEFSGLLSKFDEACQKWAVHVKSVNPPELVIDWSGGKKGAEQQFRNNLDVCFARLCAMDPRFIRPANEDWDFVPLDFAKGLCDDMREVLTAVALKQNEQVLLTKSCF